MAVAAHRARLPLAFFHEIPERPIGLNAISSSKAESLNVSSSCGDAERVGAAAVGLYEIATAGSRSPVKGEIVGGGGKGSGIGVEGRFAHAASGFPKGGTSLDAGEAFGQHRGNEAGGSPGVDGSSGMGTHIWRQCVVKSWDWLKDEVVVEWENTGGKVSSGLSVPSWWEIETGGGGGGGPWRA